MVDSQRASTQTWKDLDEAMLQLSRSTATEIRIVLDATDPDIPEWDAFPYECLDELCQQVLPGCTAEGIVVRCDGEWCRLHHPYRRLFQFRGTLQDMLEVLPAWTWPVTRWEVTMESTLLENLKLLQETQTLWSAIAKIFSLSLATHPAHGEVYIQFRLEGWGKLVLASIDVGGTFYFLALLPSDLITVQTTTRTPFLYSTVYGLF